MFQEVVLNKVMHSIECFPERNAFCIKDEFFTYLQFGQTISAISVALTKYDNSSSRIGLVINDDLETYAAIIALWSKGMCYIPLHPEWPIERCNSIVDQVEIKTIIDTSEKSRFEHRQILNPTNLSFAGGGGLVYENNVPDKEIAYILFTSGSTGVPKGVPISRHNLSSFVEAFWDMGFEINENDRVLQCFDLSFDLSVMSYLIPLIKGACVYTVPNNVVKYSHVAMLLEDYNLTVALMAPSTISYLRPYFSDLKLPDLHYSLFCGEALHEDVTSEWSKCCPNADIYNVYGPTEDTIFCSYYQYDRINKNKEYNGVLCIGKSMTSGEMIILGDDGKEVSPGNLGELCLSGNQLFDGYWKNETKTKEVFLTLNNKKYYRTGDLCYIDEDGDFMYSGRLDYQAQIQGFRVELGEIEFHAREYLQNIVVVCVAFTGAAGLTEIAMFIESEDFDTKNLVSYMRSKMPSYMIPSQIIFKNPLPLNINGKIDRKALKGTLS